MIFCRCDLSWDMAHSRTHANTKTLAKYSTTYLDATHMREKLHLHSALHSYISLALSLFPSTDVFALCLIPKKTFLTHPTKCQILNTLCMRRYFYSYTNKYLCKNRMCTTSVIVHQLCIQLTMLTKQKWFRLWADICERWFFGWLWNWTYIWPCNLFKYRANTLPQWWETSIGAVPCVYFISKSTYFLMDSQANKYLHVRVRMFDLV